MHETMKRSYFGVLSVIALAACAPRLAPLPALAERASPVGAGSCDDAEEIDERLVVDWSPLDRSRLESAVRSGLVLVRVDGCRARVVDTCTVVRRPYAFSATSRQREIMLVRDSGELGVKLPLLASRFGASVSRSSALDVTMTVVGRFEAGASALSASDVEGECSGVTHFVSSVSVGAFAISTTDEASANASADLLVAGSHAAYANERRHVDSAGIEEHCSLSRRADGAPPEDCAIPLRIELRRLGAHASPPSPPLSPPPAGPSDEMRHAMELAKKQLVPCHRAARASAPDLSGLLTLGIKLGRRGNVKSVSAKHEGGLPDGLSVCAIERIALVSFPAADDDRPRTVVIPVLFRPLAESPPAR